MVCLCYKQAWTKVQKMYHPIWPVVSQIHRPDKKLKGQILFYPVKFYLISDLKKSRVCLFAANINQLGPISDISALRLKTYFICMAYVVVLTGWVNIMVTCCKSHV